MHARAAGGVDRHQRNAPFDCRFSGTNEFLAENRAHAGAEEVKITDHEGERLPFHRCLTGNDRFELAALALGAFQAALIGAAAVSEPERILRQQVAAPLLERADIGEHGDALTCSQPEVVFALRANPEIVDQFP